MPTLRCSNTVLRYPNLSARRETSCEEMSCAEKRVLLQIVPPRI
jgi:hypothetical protein